MHYTNKGGGGIVCEVCAKDLGWSGVYKNPAGLLGSPSRVHVFS
jgi:hypothetical protein